MQRPLVDEDFWNAALRGTDKLDPIQLAASSFRETRTGALKGTSQDLLIHLRGRMYEAIERQSATLEQDRMMGRRGPLRARLSRAVLQAVGLTPDNVTEWGKLEWATKPQPLLREGMEPGEILEALNAVSESGFSALRAGLTKTVRKLLEGDDEDSQEAVVVRGANLGNGQGSGDVLRLFWCDDFADWIANVPKVFLNATGRAEIVRLWSPDLDVTEVEIRAPHQHVLQVVGHAFGRSFFQWRKADLKRRGPGFDGCHPNIAHLADLTTMELALAGDGTVLLVAQKAVREWLEAELRRRVAEGRLPAWPEEELRDADTGRLDAERKGLPNRLFLAHHGAVTGMNAWRHVRRMLVVGRPATNRTDGEWLAALTKRGAVETVEPGEEVEDRNGDAEEGGAGDRHDGSGDSRWPTRIGGIRMADGTGVAVRQPHHPDALVEAIRWATMEGAVIQAIGRAWGVRRGPKDPVHITVLGWRRPRRH